jgi:hypothetical protein
MYTKTVESVDSLEQREIDTRVSEKRQRTVNNSKIGNKVVKFFKDIQHLHFPKCTFLFLTFNISSMVQLLG